MSRSGSKRGDQRSGFGGMPGANDQWQSVGNRPPPKAADMTGFGNIKIGGGPSTFGPSSVFANKKKPKTGDVTPPMSRSASTSNMFSALRDADASGEMSSVEEGAGGAEAPQRKKLVLAPRTVSSANIGEEETAPEAQSKEDVERKIKADLAEFWGEKGTIGTRNTDDVVTYFENLSEDARSDLARQLVDDVFRLSSAEDTKLVAEAFTKAIAAGVLQAEAVKQG
jgi:translation initiation factor 4G